MVVMGAEKNLIPILALNGRNEGKIMIQKMYVQTPVCIYRYINRNLKLNIWV